MKLITGQLKPSKGTVTVLGEPIWDNPGPTSRSASARAGRVLRADDRPGWVTALVRLNGYDERRPRRPRRRSPRSTCSRPRTRRSAPTARACASASRWRRRWSTIPDC
jgi:hypothetical protein